MGWFAAATALLTETFPIWGSFRASVGLMGLGIAVGAVLPGLGLPGVLLMTGLRLTTFFMAPAPPPTIAPAPPPAHAALEFETLARLQRYAGTTRSLLTTRFPTLPPGSAIGRHHRPLMAEHAFASGRAAQVWYRDSALRWVEWREIKANPGRPLVTVSEYLSAIGAMRESRLGRALTHLDRADALEQDRGAAVFLGSLAGKRAICGLGLHDAAMAEREAMRGLRLWPDGGDARYCLAALLESQGNHRGALAHLDTVLEKYPFDESAAILRDSLRIELERAVEP
jgi:tetratricopeptide (TPR) repeat protein